MKKALSFLLALLTLCTAFYGCAENSDQPDDSTAAAAESDLPAETEAGETLREDYPDGVPDTLKYTGETFRVLYRDSNNYREDFVATEISGDMINDAVYTRNTTVMDRFGMTL